MRMKWESEEKKLQQWLNIVYQHHDRWGVAVAWSGENFQPDWFSVCKRKASTVSEKNRQCSFKVEKILTQKSLI